MSKVLRLITTILLASLVIACGSEPVEETEEAAVRPVKLLVLEGAGAGESRRYPAVVDAAQSSELAFQVGGLLQELPVSEAQSVEQGAVLARLDSRDFQSQLDAVQAEFATAEAEYQRAQRLAEGNAIAASEVEQRTSRYDAAKAQLESAQKALDDAVLRAPFAGIVSKVHAEKFQNVAAQAAIVTLIGTAGLEATINMPASVIATSKQVEEANAAIVFDAAPSVRIPAEFREASLEADAASQTYEVTFGFAPPEELVILPGMNATLILETSMATPEGEDTGAGVAVPLAAVMSEGERNFVWVIDPESMVVSKRWVTLEAGVGESMVATEGIQAGETIAGAGAAYLAEGMQVRPWTD